MSDFYSDLNSLVNSITEGKANYYQTERRIEEIKERYGNDVFPSFTFEKQPRPWTKEYLMSLLKRNVTGACSEDFILHIAEVNDYVNSKRKKRIISIAICLIVIVFAVIVLTSLSNKSWKI